MRHSLAALALACVAFTAGFFAAHQTQRADAAPAIAAQAADLTALRFEDLPATGKLRKKMFIDVGSMTLGLYIGPTVRHYHANANEFQYVVSGTGTEWFGKKKIALKPGLLLIIPKGMAHGGVSDRVTLLEGKTPAQDPQDNHPI